MLAGADLIQVDAGEFDLTTAEDPVDDQDAHDRQQPHDAMP
jgi:hypothetical protein